MRDPSPQFGPRTLEEQWAAQLTAKKLFPLRAIPHDGTPNERFRFESKKITAEKIHPAYEKARRSPHRDHPLLHRISEGSLTPSGPLA